jgi:copper resistance protein B
MKRFLFLLAASALTTPAIAQTPPRDHARSAPVAGAAAVDDAHSDHQTQEGSAHGDHQPSPRTPTDPHAGHHAAEGPQPGDPHAADRMSRPEGSHPRDPIDQAGAHARQPVPESTGGAAAGAAAGEDARHAQTEQEAVGHAEHHAPAEAALDAHAGHDTTHTAVDPPVAPPPPEAFSGPEDAADAYYGDTAMARARSGMTRMHGAIRTYRVLVDRLEAKFRNGRDGYALDAEAWYGGDIDKLWLKGELDGEFAGEFEGAEIQALWSHAIGPFFDLQTGVRLDLQAGTDRGHLVLGVQGLAPYWIEVEAAGFVSDKGDVTARFEAEHDMRITQQLILQPVVEAEFALQDIPEELVGAGLSEIRLGARFRYQVTQLFAPYIGVEYERAFGDSRRFRRLAGEDVDGFNFVAGIRTWF